tara:strand:- start:1633 stop:2112 length:480 start_codon:yes stop_codon:yes gene_type:complete
MQKNNVLTYLTNNHLTKNELVEKYNQKLKDEGELYTELLVLEKKYNELNNRHTNLQKYSQELVIEKESLKSNLLTLKEEYKNNRNENSEETIILLIELNDELQKRYDNTVIEVKDDICELLNVIDDIKHKINNNEYLKCMGFLKNINETLSQNESSDDE